jgi:hypothetical protein
MWRALNCAVGVLEADNAGAARAWIERRPDIDALVVDDDLPDGRGLELVNELVAAQNPVASRAIVLARRADATLGAGLGGPALLDRADFAGVLHKLASWFFSPEVVKALRREAERLSSRRGPRPN